MLDGKTEVIKLTVSGMAAGFISAFGVDHKFLIVLLILMGTDTALGWMKGFKLHSFTSGKAKWGTAGKIIELALIYILGRLDWAFDTNGLLANIGVFYYGIVELASIFENVHDGKLATLPPGLMELLQKLKYSAGKIVVDKLKKGIASMLGVDLDAVKDDEEGDPNHENKP